MEKYTPGGYSWLCVAPESKTQLEIEKLQELYKKSRDPKILEQIKDLEAIVK